MKELKRGEWRYEPKGIVGDDGEQVLSVKFSSEEVVFVVNKSDRNLFASASDLQLALKFALTKLGFDSPEDRDHFIHAVARNALSRAKGDV